MDCGIRLGGLRSCLISHWLCSIFVFLASSTVCYAEDSRIGVIYPLLQKPYHSVFERIIDGISEASDTEVAKYTIKNTTEENEMPVISEWMLRQQLDVVIALGRRGVERIVGIDTAPSVFGGVLYVTDTILDQSPGISLTPDPKHLFEMLRRLSPATKRVFVVYNPARYQWLVDVAQPAAMKLGLKLSVFAVDGVRDSARIHRRILNNANRGDAIWLLQDLNIVGEKAVLPMILKKSWDKQIVVFSSNPGHVPRGVLFSLYPDNRALGISLARLAMERLKHPKKKPNVITPLFNTLSAVNMRTANHIGLHLSNDVQKTINLVFPRK